MSGICSAHKDYVKGCPQCEIMDCQNQACSFYNPVVNYNCVWHYDFMAHYPEQREACFGWVGKEEE